HQSYTYFTWRNTRDELAEYLAEVSGEAGAYMRPSFWPTTHDILPPYLQHGGVAGFAVRAVLAALGSPTWGIYSGYELVENVPRPGVEEQIDNEKYEYKPRDWSQAAEIGISTLLTRLNEIRRDHPALRQLRNLTIDRKSTRLNSSHVKISYAVFCLKKNMNRELWCIKVEEIAPTIEELDLHEETNQPRQFNLYDCCLVRDYQS